MARNKNKNKSGRQTRRKLSFYEEIADPDFNSKTNRRADAVPDKSIRDTSDSRKKSSTNSNFGKSRSQSRVANKTSTNTFLSKNLTIFYIVVFLFLVFCILFSILMYSCKSNTDADIQEINELTTSQEMTLDENSAAYSSLMSTSVEKEFIKQIIPEDVDVVTSMNSTKQINITSDTTISDSNMSQLRSEVEKITNKDNCYLSFCLIDIYTKKAIYYNIDAKLPTFSTIKAPYITSCVSQDIDIFYDYKEGIYQAIKYSENYPYETMWSEIGLKYLRNWWNELNISDSMEQIEYPFNFKVRNMTKLWLKIFEQFNTNDEISTFKSYFSHTKNSGIDTALGDKYLVQSKAGWGDGSADYTGYNDCGIVSSGDYPYIVCVFSGYNYDNEKITSLVEYLDKCHDDMVAENKQNQQN